MTPTLRLFFAIEIAPILREAIATTVHQLKQHGGLQQVHWSRPENWHMTVCFIGAMQQENVALYIQRAIKALQRVRTFEFTLGPLLIFPAQHPRVLAIQVPLSLELAALHQTMQGVTIAVGYKQGKRAFFPHITLGRVLTDEPVSLDKRIVPPTPPQSVKEIVLFASKAHPEGSIYTVIERLALPPSSPH